MDRNEKIRLITYRVTGSRFPAGFIELELLPF